MSHNFPFSLLVCLAAALTFSGCGPESPVMSEAQITQTASPTDSHLAATSTFTRTPQSMPISVDYGPGPAQFPAGINPLTGQPVADATLLQIPVMLVSISHFPPTARPQAGLSFAPYVFEFSITEGATRFLTAFYGEFPYPENPINGGCAVRPEPFIKTGTLLGSRVWLDSNGNGVRDLGEPGIQGLCVNLYDAQSELIKTTTTDSNGYYGFNVQDGMDYKIQFVKPPGFELSPQNIGDDGHDSDVNPSDGQTPVIHVMGDDLSWDAGLMPSANAPTPTGEPQQLPKAQIGPVRSGRLLYAYIAGFFQDSCLIYAFASPEVLAKIPKCAFVTHEVDGGGYMLDIDRFKAIALENRTRTVPGSLNYTGNVYADQPPAGGAPANQLNVFFASLNQSGWTYDPLYQAYLRYVDTADPNARGVLHPEVDRLNGQQLHFENVIVLMADTDVVSPTNLDIHLDEGDYGYAFLFRDGMMYRIRWSTRAGDYEQQTGFRRPIQFQNADGSPAPLKPGHTWVIIVTPFSYFAETQPGIYLARYIPPSGEAR